MTRSRRGLKKKKAPTFLTKNINKRNGGGVFSARKAKHGKAPKLYYDLFNHYEDISKYVLIFFTYNYTSMLFLNES